MPYKATATMTSKGQVTVPAGIGDRLSVKSGDRLDFQLSDSDKLTVTHVKRRSIFDDLERLQLPSLGRALTQADIDNAIGDAMMEQKRRIRALK